MVPRTGPLSASSAFATTSWYQRGKSSLCEVSTRATGPTYGVRLLTPPRGSAATRGDDSGQRDQVVRATSNPVPLSLRLSGRPWCPGSRSSFGTMAAARYHAIRDGRRLVAAPAFRRAGPAEPGRVWG